VALSMACKDFFPTIDLVKALSAAVGLSDEFVSNLHCKIFKNNVGALTLAKLEPARMTPRSNHYCLKYHWFRTRISDPASKITLHKIDSANQLGDIFTKGLTEVIRSKGLTEVVRSFATFDNGLVTNYLTSRGSAEVQHRYELRST
jgi:hypothetical protein